MTRRLSAGDTVVLASHNPGKLRELSALMSPFGVNLVAASAQGLPEPDETATDFVGNARLKALAASRVTGLPALADDSGFCVAALGGAPGIHSARWAGPGKDFAAAMARVQRETAGDADDRAWFVCVLCVAWADGETASFQGRVDGRMVWPPQGANGFGYDPMFVPNGDTVSFGEMSAEAKEAASHRARAMRQLAAAVL